MICCPTNAADVIVHFLFRFTFPWNENKTSNVPGLDGDVVVIRAQKEERPSVFRKTRFDAVSYTHKSKEYLVARLQERADTWVPEYTRQISTRSQTDTKATTDGLPVKQQ